MPVNKSAMLRYRIIDQMLRSKQRKFPSLSDISEEVRIRLYGVDSKSISASTIEKDIANMRNDTSLGILAPIAYDKQEKGYYYTDPNYSMNGLGLTEDDQQTLREAASLLQFFAGFPVLANLKLAIDKISTRLMLPGDLNNADSSKVIRFEQSQSRIGFRWINPIYNAIINDKEILFDYVKIYQGGEVKKSKLEPYQLREKYNTWYVIGYNRNHGKFITYALDRIQSLEIGTTFLRDVDFNEEDFYKDAIGIMANDQPAEKVVLELTGPSALFFQFNPIHPSQQVISQSETSITVELQLNVNEELVSRILAHAKSIRVVEPMALRDRLLNELRLAMKNQDQSAAD
jgi:predicted DNA-binding transcriptional regulator YafY